MAITKININGIHELDFNLSGTTTASTSAGITTINNTPAIATSSTVGVVKPDNNTIQVAGDGTLTASGPAPTFVQGASSTSLASTMAVSLSGITLANSLLVHVRCGNSSAPGFSGIGNPYVLIHSQYNSFWGVGTYTYLCFAALATTENITFTGLVGSSACILAEYTPAAGYEAATDNGVSANAQISSSLGITSTKSFERAIFFFSCGSFSGQTLNQTQRVPTSGTSGIVLMDAAAPTSGTTISGTVTSSAMNNPSITGFFLSSLGVVQSVGLSMPSDFTVTGSPVTSTGILQVTGGVTKAAVQQEAYTYAADTGSANAYAVTLTPAPTIVVGSEVVFKAANTNTSASTLTVNGTTYPLKKNGTSALTANDIVSGQMVTAKCDGANFQITTGAATGATQSGVQQETYTYANDTGAANAYAVTLTPTPSLVAGSEVVFRATNANTGASTLAVNGGSAISITKNGNSTALATGDITAGQIVTVKYDGTVWQMSAPATTTSGVTSLNSLTGALSIVAGANVTVTPSGSNITIAASGGSGTNSVVTKAIYSAGTGMQRVSGTVYQNTASFPILVAVVGSNLAAFTDASSTPTTQVASLQESSGNAASILFMVMPSNFYKVVESTGTLQAWTEWTFNTGTWTQSGDLVGSKALNTVYQNTSGGTKIILVNITGGGGTMAAVSDSSASPITTIANQSTGSTFNFLLFFVPNNYYYKVTSTAGSLAHWNEYSSGSIPCSVSTNLAVASLANGPATRAVTSNSSFVPVIAFLNNTSKARFVSCSFTNANLGTLVTACDYNSPPFQSVWNGAYAAGVTKAVFAMQMPNEFLYAKQDSGTSATTFWYEFTLG